MNRPYEAASVPVGNPLEPAVATAELQLPGLDLTRACSGRGAVLSDEGVYRYHLWRCWDCTKPRVAWLMLNPSTADADVDDPTIRRCMGFAKAWEFGGIEVVNLFAYRATDPADLLRCPVNVVGPDNFHWHRTTAEKCPTTIAAWGAHPSATPLAVRNALAAMEGRTALYALGTTKSGAPRHPLYVKGDVEPVRWPQRESVQHDCAVSGHLYDDDWPWPDQADIRALAPGSRVGDPCIWCDHDKGADE